jgi:hypothetical protein
VKQGTRLFKAQCGDCAYTVRVTRKWLAELGPPLCPCNSEPMECDWLEEQRPALEADAPSYRLLRDRWVETRVPHRCDRCRLEYPRDDKMRHRAYVVGNELYNTYTCMACDGTGAEQRARVGYA